MQAFVSRICEFQMRKQKIHPSLTKKAQLLYDIVGKGRAQVTSLAGMVTSLGQNALTRSPNKDKNYTKEPLEYNPQNLVQTEDWGGSHNETS